MPTIQFTRDLLAVMYAANITDGQIEHEHDSVPVEGDITDLITKLTRDHGFQQRGGSTFLRREDLQIELTFWDIPQHQGWRARTVHDFTTLRGALMSDSNFVPLQKYSVRQGGSMMSCIFQHESSKKNLQIIWREEDIFPPRWGEE